MSVLFDQKTDVYWEYGINQGVYSFSTSNFIAAKDTALDVDFTGLTPDTKYFYRTRYRLNGTSNAFLAGPEHTFHTRRAPGSSFSFTVEADEHLYDKKGVRSIYQITLANEAKDNPDFMFTLGDIFGDDHYPTTITSAEMDALHKDYRQYLGNICHSVPLFICLGNHEGEKDFYLRQNPPDNIAVYATLWRKFYYANPYPNNFYTGNPDIEPYGMDHPENYYAWKWGDALFVVLDVYRDQCDTSAKPKNWDWSLGLPQYTWLKNTLENSTEKYKFVFAHHTRGEGRGGITTAKYFEWGGYEANGTTWGFTTHRTGWEKPIHQLFVDNGVNIFFQGHDHLFAHEVQDGVVYQEVPMPSDSTYKIGMLANADAYVSDTLDGSGHVKVTVSESCVKVDYIRAYLPADTISGIHHNREVAFSYTIGTCSSLGITDQDTIPEIIIYPNPADDKLTIGLQEGIKPVQISLISTLGRILLQTQSKTIDVSSFPDGIYFLNILTATFEMNKKVVISRY
ncbi:MAG: T9SS type A sorting domain-containing protein [Bacteroidetes bacterium]|nr:T9SS type A sorting domain-containing protein [Bacteroidota bacterium]